MVSREVMYLHLRTGIGEHDLVGILPVTWHSLASARIVEVVEVRHQTRLSSLSRVCKRDDMDYSPLCIRFEICGQGSLWLKNGALDPRDVKHRGGPGLAPASMAPCSFGAPAS